MRVLDRTARVAHVTEASSTVVAVNGGQDQATGAA